MSYTRVSQASVSVDEFQGESAGEELVERAMENGEVEDPDFGLMFCSVQFELEGLASAVEDEIPDCEWLGSTTAGEISSTAYGQGNAVILLVETDEIDLRTSRGDSMFEHPENAGRSAAEELVDEEFLSSDRQKMLLAYTCGFNLKNMDAPEHYLLRGIRDVVGSNVPVFGAAGADEYRMTGDVRTFLNGEVHEDSIVMARIETDLELHVGLDNGYRDVQRTGVITEMADRRTVAEIDGEPAAEWYADTIGVDVSDLTSPATMGSLSKDVRVFLAYAWYRLKGEDPEMVHESANISRMSPLADVLEAGNMRVRVPMSVTDDHGLVFARPPLYEGTQLNVLDADMEDVLSAADRAFDGMSSERNLFGFVAECSRRYRIMNDNEDNLVEDQRRLSRAFNAPFVGFFSYGELGADDKLNCKFNNQTVTGFVFRRPE